MISRMHKYVTQENVYSYTFVYAYVNEWYATVGIHMYLRTTMCTHNIDAGVCVRAIPFFTGVHRERISVKVPYWS